MDAYVYLRVRPGSIAEVLTQLTAKQGVRRAVPVVGEWDVLALIEASDFRQIANVVVSQMHAIDGVTRTFTAPVVPPDRIGITGGAFAAPPVPVPLTDACYVHVKAQAGAVEGLVERLSEVEDIAGYAVLGGVYDLIIAVPHPWEVASSIIIDRIQPLPGIVSTSTLVSVSLDEGGEDRDQFSSWS